MSLQLAAEHLSTKGRGPDDTLVHMSRGEVKSLNDLAMAHGGHLTINPETGLPEAGFLSMILPMVAGAALGPAGFGLTSALGAGLAVGAGSYLLNPKAGLMGALSAGMGAYGAANLGQALAVEGMNASVPAAAQVTPEGVNAFTTDPSAYIAQSPTTSQFGAFGEAPTGAQVVAKNAPYSGMSAAPPTSTAYPALNPDAANVNGLTFTPKEQFSASNPYAGTPSTQPVRPQVAGFGAGASNAAPAGASNVSFGTPSGGGGSSFATDPAGSFQSSTIAKPLVSPNASIADLKDMTVTERLGAIQKGLTSGDLGKVASENYGSVAAVASPLLTKKDESVAPVVDRDRGQQYSYSPGVARPLPAANVPTYEDMLTKQGNFGQQQNYYPDQGYTPISNERAKEMYRYAADGGLMSYANGGPVEQMSNNAAMGANTMYPMANMATSSFATPYQTPQSTNMLANMAPSGGGAVNAMSGEPNMQGTRMAEGGEADSAPSYTYDAKAQKYVSSVPTVPMNAGISSAMGMAYDPATQRFTGGNAPTDQIYLGGGQYGFDEATKRAQAEAAAAAASGAARGGLMGYADGGLSNARYNLGGYSDGGRLLRGPGDGVSDSIPAVIGKRQPARLADGEFVVPARIVSEIGNGSTEAGARKLYAMMDRIQAARGKTVGKGKVAKNTRADKYLPA